LSSILIIPSIREIKLEYLEPALPEFDRLLVVDDSDGAIAVPCSKAQVFDYRAQRSYMGRHYALVPHKSKACAFFGTFFAFKEGFEKIAVLDDDCRVSHSYGQALGLLNKPEVFPGAAAGDSGWFDPIPLDRYWARGFPFHLRRVRKTPPDFTHPFERRVMAICGLWSGYLDVNAIDKLALEFKPVELPKVEMRWALGHFPMSGMNLFLTREAVPAYPWLPKWGVSEGFFLNRHEDIWAGYILQKVAHHLSWGLAYGPPIVEHLKLGDLEAELISEYCEAQLCRWFYDAVGEVVLKGDSTVDLTAQIGEGLVKSGSALKKSALHLPGDCLLTMGRFIVDWMEVFASV